MRKFIELKIAFPAAGRFLVYVLNNEVKTVLPLTPDQILISYASMIEMLEKAGYEVRKK